MWGEGTPRGSGLRLTLGEPLGQHCPEKPLPSEALGHCSPDGRPGEVNTQPSSWALSHWPALLLPLSIWAPTV